MWRKQISIYIRIIEGTFSQNLKKKKRIWVSVYVILIKKNNVFNPIKVNSKNSIKSTKFLLLMSLYLWIKWEHSKTHFYTLYQYTNIQLFERVKLILFSEEDYINLHFVEIEVDSSAGYSHALVVLWRIPAVVVSSTRSTRYLASCVANVPLLLSRSSTSLNSYTVQNEIQCKINLTSDELHVKLWFKN